MAIYSFPNWNLEILSLDLFQCKDLTLHLEELSLNSLPLQHMVWSFSFLISLLCKHNVFIWIFFSYRPYFFWFRQIKCYDSLYPIFRNIQLQGRELWVNLIYSLSHRFQCLSSRTMKQKDPVFVSSLIKNSILPPFSIYPVSWPPSSPFIAFCKKLCCLWSLFQAFAVTSAAVKASPQCCTRRNFENQNQVPAF